MSDEVFLARMEAICGYLRDPNIVKGEKASTPPEKPKARKTPFVGFEGF